MIEPSEHSESDEAAQRGGDDREPNQARPARRPRRSRFLRFGLLELLLLTAMVAGWLPVVLARRQIPNLESQIESMQLATTDLIIQDADHLNVRSLPSIWYNISSWKYFAPADADLELRLATEGFSSIAYPSDYQAATLPDGEHTIHLKTTNDETGYHTQVYIDDAVVLEEHHPEDWIESYGSSSSGSASDRSIAHAISEPLKLKVQRYSYSHPLIKYRSVRIPEVYDNQGNYLWISPRSTVPAPVSDFFLQNNRYSSEGYGHRQGIRVGRPTSGFGGLICVKPSLEATFGEQRQGVYWPFAISVRPIIESGVEPEAPELQSLPSEPQVSGIPISLRSSIEPPEDYDGTMIREMVDASAIHDDGKSMKLFAHFPPFASGAQPIIEIVFDSDHPNRVGFLPHVAPNSTPIEAIQLVTQFDVRFFWRYVAMRPDGADAQSGDIDAPSITRLIELYDDIDWYEATRVSEFPWKQIPLNQLPTRASTEATTPLYELNLSSNVMDASQLAFPSGLPERWRYKGVANRQIWWIPATSNDKDSDGKATDAEATDAKPSMTAEIRATSVFPTTTSQLPGGPVVGNVRITIPMPATEPVWLEIAPN